jgi:hypothetical protein
MLGSVLLDLEIRSEESRICIGVRLIVTKVQEPATSLEDFDTDVISVNPGGLKELCNKWSGDQRRIAWAAR